MELEEHLVLMLKPGMWQMYYWALNINQDLLLQRRLLKRSKSNLKQDIKLKVMCLWTSMRFLSEFIKKALLPWPGDTTVWKKKQSTGGKTVCYRAMSIMMLPQSRQSDKCTFKKIYSKVQGWWVMFNVAWSQVMNTIRRHHYGIRIIWCQCWWDVPWVIPLPTLSVGLKPFWVVWVPRSTIWWRRSLRQ